MRKIELILRREMMVTLESRATVEVPDDFLEGYDTYDDWFRDNWDPVNRCLKGLPDDIGSQLDVNETCVDALSDNDDEDWEFYWVKD